MIVYKITNNRNNKVYVGQTVRSLEERWIEHKKPSNDCIALRNAIKKYGIESFSKTILTYCDSIDSLNYWENYYINLYNSCDKTLGYNCNYGGNNKLHTLETKLKMSTSAKGRQMKESSKDKLRKRIIDQFGNSYSSITEAHERLNISLAMIHKSCNTGCTTKGFNFQYMRN